MMGLETIREMNRERTGKAAKARRAPRVFSRVQLDTLTPEGICASIPALGDYVHESWEQVAEHFVDSSGFGAEDEAAMTVHRFAKLVKSKPGRGWGVGEAGQFQVYVNEYRRKEA